MGVYLVVDCFHLELQAALSHKGKVGYKYFNE